MFSAASSAGCTVLRFAHLCVAGTTTWNGSSYRNSVAIPGGANGSATIAASMRPDRKRTSRFSVRFSSISSGICGARSCSAGIRSGSRYGRHRVYDAELERPGQLVAPRLRDLADPRRLLQHPLRLLDDALADRSDRHLVLAAFEHRAPSSSSSFWIATDSAGWLTKHLLRRASEIALLRDRDEVAELVERHARGEAAALGQERGERRGSLRMPEAEIDSRFEVARACCRNRSGGPRTR